MRDVSGVLTAHVSLPKQTYGTEQARLAFFRKLAVASEEKFALWPGISDSVRDQPQVCTGSQIYSMYF